MTNGGAGTTRSPPTVREARSDSFRRRRRSRHRSRGVAAFSLLAGVIVGFGMPGAAATVPTLQIGSSVLVPGTFVAITGHDWPVPTTLQATLCGANDVDGSIDCAANAAATMSANNFGKIADQLQVVVPPRPCPCVILFSALESGYTSRLPVEVVGAPVAPIVSQAPNILGQTLVVKAKVTGSGTVGSFFGFPAPRVLTVTMTNIGHTPVQAPVLTAGWGTPGGVQHVIATPPLSPLAAGHTAVLRLPFQLDALSHGTYTVSGRYTGPPIPASFEAKTTAPTPWGVLIVALLLLQLVLLTIRNIVRRRLRRRDAARRSVARALVPPATAVSSSARVAVVPGPVIALGGPREGAAPPIPAGDELPSSFVPPPPPPRGSDPSGLTDDAATGPAPVASDTSIHWTAPESAAPAGR